VAEAQAEEEQVGERGVDGGGGLEVAEQGFVLEDLLGFGVG
jgi:hypothetical protein